MSKITIVLILFLTLYFCATMTYKREKKAVSQLTYVQVDTLRLDFRQEVYIPVNSHLHSEYGSRPLNLTTVLKIRNTSFYDSIYVFKIEYYDSEGEPLKKSIDSIFLVKPMSTIQIIVRKNEFKKPVDNCIVEWRAAKPKLFPLIQAISSDPNNKLAFTTDGIVINNIPPTRSVEGSENVPNN